MDDAVFISEVRSTGLLPMYLRERLELPCRTSADKAAFFLDNVIEPSVTHSDDSRFRKLLNIMGDCEHQGVTWLVKLIIPHLGKLTSLRKKAAAICKGLCSHIKTYVKLSIYSVTLRN